MSEYVLCINNKDNPASLIVGKVYRTLSDSIAEKHNMLRVLDEDNSEMDGYIYPSAFFVPIEIPESAKQAIASSYYLGENELFS